MAKDPTSRPYFLRTNSSTAESSSNSLPPSPLSRKTPSWKDKYVARIAAEQERRSRDLLDQFDDFDWSPPRGVGSGGIARSSSWAAGMGAGNDSRPGSGHGNAPRYGSFHDYTGSYSAYSGVGPGNSNRMVSNGSETLLTSPVSSKSNDKLAPTHARMGVNSRSSTLVSSNRGSVADNLDQGGDAAHDFGGTNDENEDLEINEKDGNTKSRENESIRDHNDIMLRSISSSRTLTGDMHMKRNVSWAPNTGSNSHASSRKNSLRGLEIEDELSKRGSFGPSPIGMGSRRNTSQSTGSKKSSATWQEKTAPKKKKKSTLWRVVKFLIC